LALSQIGSLGARKRHRGSLGMVVALVGGVARWRHPGRVGCGLVDWSVAAHRPACGAECRRRSVCGRRACGAEAVAYGARLPRAASRVARADGVGTSVARYRTAGTRRLARKGARVCAESVAAWRIRRREHRGMRGEIEVSGGGERLCWFVMGADAQS